jgi:hypothetical protein
MKKIYSFVLMAAMLLVGANAWAEDTSYQDVQDAFDGTATTLTLESELFEELTFENQLVLNADKHFVLDLGGLTLIMNAPTNPAILVKRGVLTIKNGTIQNQNAATIDLIRVVGTTANGYDAEHGNVYSQVIIESDAKIYNTQSSGSTKFNALTITEVASATPYSNGARIDVKSGAYLQATTYGIKVNGTIRRPVSPATDADAPYVHIHSGAQVIAGSASNKKAVAAYCAGYAHWLIEGECIGGTGVYVKAGDVDIHGATVSSNYTGEYDAIDNESSKSGVTGAGSAIAVESNQNYSGAIDVTVDGGSTLTAGSGYALEEKVSNNDGTPTTSDVKVDAVKVEDASFNKGNGEGAISISKETTEVAYTAAQDGNEETNIIVMTSAIIEGDITFGGATTSDDPEAPQVTLNDLVTTSAVVPGASENEKIVVPMTIIPNENGYASYSAPIDLLPPTGLVVYTGVMSDNEEELNLVSVDYIKANAGVILVGEPGVKKTLTQTATNYEASAGDLAKYEANKLKASVDWENNHSGNIFCLRRANNETSLWKYTGTEMPANKAYLQLDDNAAPARIRMVIAETQDVENVEVEAIKAVKFIENGQVLIKRGEAIYNVQGQIVK